TILLLINTSFVIRYTVCLCLPFYVAAPRAGRNTHTHTHTQTDTHTHTHTQHDRGMGGVYPHTPRMTQLCESYTHTHTRTHTHTHTHTGMLLCVNTHCIISSLQWGFLR